MTNREFFLKRWEEEYPMFLKVFRALPKDKPDYRPHPRSRSAAALVLEEQACSQWIDAGKAEWKETPPPKSLEEAIAAYARAQAKLAPRLTKLDDRRWEEEKVQLIVGGDAGTYELPLGELLWAVLFDSIHHRGQLTLYIRLTGGKVPPIYGSSADEKLA